MEKALIRTGYVCNNRCLLCPVYSNNNFNGLSTNEIKNRIIQAKKAGCGCILLSGGEPTIRKDIIDLASFISSQGLSFELMTNGRMMAYQDFTEKLKKNGLKRVIVALYSESPEVHDSLSGVKGSFNQTVEGIKNLLKCCVEVMINVLITKYNVFSLKNIIDFCYSNFPEIKKIKLAFPSALGRAIENYELVPMLEEASKEVIDAIRFGEKKNLSIFTENFPLCLLDGHEDSVYERNEHGIKKLMEVFDNDLLPIEECETKIKVDKCRFCSKNKNCKGISEEYVKRFGQKELKPYSEKNQIAELEVTELCNRNCIFCYKTFSKEPITPDIANLKRSISKISKENVKELILTGGEPLLNKNLDELIRFAKLNQINNVILQTNASLIDEKKAEELKKAGLDIAYVALPAHEKELHFKLTGSELTRTIQGIKSLLSADIETHLVFVLTYLNYKILPEYIEFVSKELSKVGGINIIPLYLNEKIKNKKEIIPMFSEIKDFLMNAIRKSEEKGIGVSISEGMPFCLLDNYKKYSIVPQLIVDKTSVDYYFIRSQISRDPAILAKENSKKEVCSNCSLNNSCTGPWPGYREIYGSKELKPVNSGNKHGNN